MNDISQERTRRNIRKRLRQRGLARFEVLGLEADRQLIRLLAKRLADDGPAASRLRTTVNRALSDASPKVGGILAALRRSPLFGADLEVARIVTHGRKIDALPCRHLSQTNPSRRRESRAASPVSEAISSAASARTWLFVAIAQL